MLSKRRSERSEPALPRGGGTLSHMALLAITCVAALALLASTASAAQQPVDLGTADSFAALSGTTVTNAGFSTLNGDLGVSPGSALTGLIDLSTLPPGRVRMLAGDGKRRPAWELAREEHRYEKSR